jgi:hypothetical protein
MTPEIRATHLDHTMRNPYSYIIGWWFTGYDLIPPELIQYETFYSN